MLRPLVFKENALSIPIKSLEVEMAEWHLRLAMRSGQIRSRLNLRATSAPSADVNGQRSPHKSNPRSHMDKGPKPAPF